jgi:hypothetical protein
VSTQLLQQIMQQTPASVGILQPAATLLAFLPFWHQNRWE